MTVWLAGAFAVTGGGAPDRATVGSRKARLLLALLAVFRGRVVPTDRIVDVLWPGQRPRRPEREVATLVSRLRGALGAGSCSAPRPVTAWGTHPRSGST